MFIMYRFQESEMDEIWEREYCRIGLDSIETGGREIKNSYSMDKNRCISMRD
jgi:hypothetical protein